ncbi:Rhodanese-like domain-containing protein [Catenaria anguillulae PL171]|uniref:Sulfurtransferase n=1 Tax=Catenaria anguillulae PL171 TaxID=765915 RepID=A0A1Y2HG06_9FUNG|nr:Rhodanese-like domain-containing protein [Catenaria anguillulae PL171]
MSFLGRLPMLLNPTTLHSFLRTTPPTKLTVLDTTWHLPTAGRPPALSEYLAGPRIPTARFFDLDVHCDHATTLPHMLPSAGDFAATCRHLGIYKDSLVVLYDNSHPVGVRASCRVWWTLRAFGFPKEQIAVLNGGLAGWIKEGLDVESTRLTEADVQAHATQSADPNVFGTRFFEPELQTDLIRTMDQVAQRIAQGAATIVDARPPGRFAGRDPEPRPGIESGHMPGAFNVPSSSVLDADGKFKSTGELRALFAPALKDLCADESAKKDLIASCGSGVTAAVLAFALEYAGLAKDVSVYDGSWSEWAAKGGEIVKDA